MKDTWKAPSWITEWAFTLPVARWGLAAGAAVATFVLLHLLLGGGLRRMRRVAAASANRIDDALVEVLGATRRWLVSLFAVLVGVGLLELPSPWDRRLGQLWFIALAVQLALWGTCAIGLLLEHYVARHAPKDPVHLGATSVLISWGLRALLWTMVVLAIMSNLGVNITAFVASLGIGGVAVALAVQNILGDLFASLSIAIDKPFQVGDAIAVGTVSGSIEYVGLKSTRIRSSGGEQIVMSNTDLLKQTISNYGRLERRRVVFALGLTYDTTPEPGFGAKVPGIVKEIVGASEKVGFDRAHFKSFGESSLDFEIVYNVLSADYAFYMDEQQRINLALLRRLSELGMQFAFPTRTLVVTSPAVQRDSTRATERWNAGPLQDRGH